MKKRVYADIVFKTLDEGDIVWDTTEPIKAVFFETCVATGDKDYLVAGRLAEAGWQMYLKDSNDTPIGRLADFLAFIKEPEKFIRLSRYEMLDQFYTWYNNGCIIDLGGDE